MQSVSLLSSVVCCKLLLFIAHICGSGTNVNSRFGLVLFCLLVSPWKDCLYFWFCDQLGADNNVCMRKWLLTVMRCQTAQCNGMTGSTLCLNMSTTNAIFKEMWLLLCCLKCFNLHFLFFCVFIVMIFQFSIITDERHEWRFSFCCLLCQCTSVTWCKATKAIDSVQKRCIKWFWLVLVLFINVATITGAFQ